MGKHVLTTEDVEVIHERLIRGEKGVDIARDFAVSQQTVSSIRTGESWGYATGVDPDAPRPNTDRGSLSRVDVRAIDKLLKEGVEVAVLARGYGVSYQTIYAIRMGKTWAWLTGRPVLQKKGKK
ncbi:MAG TPA: hypothetical protein VF885_14955 [Arthrobacter sp.]